MKKNILFTLLIFIFCLAANNALADWYYGMDHKMHYPQPPDTTGWDVNATFPAFLGDDWMCSETGPVEDIHFWGSWLDDSTGVITSFDISIWSNLSETDPTNPWGYSMPLTLLWWTEVFWQDVVAYQIFPLPTQMEGWYDPYADPPLVLPMNHNTFWGYNIYFAFTDSADYFYQHQDSVYWLVISAKIDTSATSGVPGTQWGWKSSDEHYMDDAVMHMIDGYPEWWELYEPPDFTVSLDLAFVITGDTVTEDWDCTENPPDGKTGGGWEIEPNNECDSANYAYCEEAYCGDIGVYPSTDLEDWWVVTLPTDTCYCLHVRVFANDTPGQIAYGMGLDPELTIYASDCVTQLFNNDNHNGTFPDAEGNDAQYDCQDHGNCYQPGTTLYIKINSPDQSTGPYLLVINCIPCPCGEEAWYWKPDTTYAATGMPDFPSQFPCHSGPTAVANCLWWYGAYGLYPFTNPSVFKDELFYYFGSDTIFDPWGGTDVHAMEAGLLAYFTGVTPYWPFVETTYQSPDFMLMAESLMVCQDIILLIGNWWQDDYGVWWRDGGRYVTMAGVDTVNMMVALSDPETDNAEAGFAGRVRPPGHATHLPTDSTHWFPVTAGGNDYPVSHDAYPVMQQSPSPGGTWWLPGFPRGFSPTHANCPQEFMSQTMPNPNPTLYPYHAEVEYAVMICPGTPEPPPIDTCSYYKPPYPDYAPAGMPDFDQKQSNWMIPGTNQWTYCGPVALADCFWWFDSKFESSTSPPPPTVSDSYPLVQSYLGVNTDDHDPLNVIPFVDSLAAYCSTGVGQTGTNVFDLHQGAIDWLTSRNLNDSFTVQLFPVDDLIVGFENLRSEVLRSQDIILLLGFYQDYDGYCEWFGGHFVTIAGTCTDPADSVFCISDPMFDKNEGHPPGPPPHPANVHNDAQYVSGPHGTMHHDRYQVVPTSCLYFYNPSGLTYVPLELANYPVSVLNAHEFLGQNTTDTLYYPYPPTGTIHTLIEWALIICPVEEEDPEIGVLPDTLSYTQCVDEILTYSDQIIICNNGGGTLTVDSIKCDLSWVTFPSFAALTLTGGACDTVDVQINTNGITSGPYNGNCHVYSDDPVNPVVNKPHIQVTVQEPDIAVLPDSIYHQQLVNTVVNYTNDFTVQNHGGCDLIYAAASPFSWVTLVGVSGLIPPTNSDNIDLQVNTNGISPGVYYDSVTITSNDPDSPVIYKPKVVIEVITEPVDSLYWKDFNGQDPDGYMPDFDQNQGVVAPWFAYCGPTSVANSLWWFQGKYPSREVVPSSYYPGNPVGFIEYLAGLMRTNMGSSPGTYVDSMQIGIDAHLSQYGLTDLLYEHTIWQPTFDTIEYEIERCQDVTLLIGFYQIVDIAGELVFWKRVGGHYVTAAGVNSEDLLIGISDPAFDNKEAGITSGIVRGTNHTHPTGHNDGISASHDIYDVNTTTVCSPGGLWELDHDFWQTTGTAYYFQYQNEGEYYWPSPEPWTCPFPPEYGMIFAEIEAAVIVSPVEGYEYLPGDMGMYYYDWPPKIQGGDLTYFVNFMRLVPASIPCNLNGFWCSADANGNCAIDGGDLSALLSFMRTLIPAPLYCPLYPPKWTIPPPTPPVGWPNCDPIPVLGADDDVIVIPTDR